MPLPQGMPLSSELKVKLPPDATNRLNLLADFCPVYARFLRVHPQWIQWLEAPENLCRDFSVESFQAIWKSLYAGDELYGKAFVEALQRFRRHMSMRIAYRDLNEFSPIENTLDELSFLAEFVVQLVTDNTTRELTEHLGTPQDEELNTPARFGVLALGKLGGGELNFCSDIDLIFYYDGEGHCLRNGKPAQLSNTEFFSRLAREISNRLQQKTEHGFLYNVDLRLRPEGSSGAIVRSLNALENYYFSAGQTWERLALMKARPIAGDRSLGDDFMESIHPFRYPRNIPPSLREEIAGVKLRIEKELLDEKGLHCDLKNGYGGIREIEFYAQGLQMLNGSRNPFIQEESTRKALPHLARYGYISNDELRFLQESYNFYRLVENRLQMPEEQQLHRIPEDPEALAALAQSLHFDSTEAFTEELNARKQCVRQIYCNFLPESVDEENIQQWSVFLAGEAASPAIAQKIGQWFWGARSSAEKGLRRFARGEAHHLLTRENVLLFLSISQSFDDLLKLAAHPLRTLERINRFADCYGARKSFLKICAQNPPLFRALCLLFDRSEFIHRLVCAHPEIFDELLLTGFRLIKASRFIQRELEHLPQSTLEELAGSLSLYVHAEQVRIAIGSVLSDNTVQGAEKALSQLTDTVLAYLLQVIDPQGELSLLALGKYGAGEMIFGSDLDLICLHREDANPEAVFEKIKKLLKVLTAKDAFGPTFEVDLRLRPHGENGVLSLTLSGFEQYHDKYARPWERQILLKSRLVPELSLRVPYTKTLRQQFRHLKDRLLYQLSVEAGSINRIREMRLHIEAEKTRKVKAPYAFKAGAGGLLDIEFITQAFQLRYGRESIRTRSPNTREALKALMRRSFLNKIDGARLLDHYNYLRTLELLLRRHNNRPVTEIDAEDSDLQHSLATWMGTESFDSFLKELNSRMQDTRELFLQLLNNLENHASYL